MDNTDWYYYVRGFEDVVESRLKEYGLVCILGLPGVGKSSTTKYLCSKNNHVFFVPRLYHRFPEDFKASNNVRGFINYATFYFNVWEDRRIEEVAYIILRIFKRKKVANKLKEIVEGIKRDFIEKFGEEGKKLIKLLESGTVESVRGSFDKIAEKFRGKEVKKLFEELHPIETVVTHLKKLVQEIDKRLDVLKVNEHAFEIVSSLMLKFHNFEVVYPWVLMVLLFSGCLHLKESLEKIFEGDVLKALKNEIEKEGILIVFDDLSDFGMVERFAIGDLISMLREFVGLGFRVLVNYRITDEEFLEFATASKEDVVYKLRDKLGFPKYDEILKNVDQVFFYPQPSFDEFNEILKAHKFKVDESYYHEAFGIPWVAILMKSVRVKPEVKDVKVVGWYSAERIGDLKKAGEKLKSNLRRVYATLRRVYDKLRNENFCYVALLVNNLAKDELKDFCRDERIRDYIEKKGLRCFHDFKDRFNEVDGKIDLNRFLVVDREVFKGEERGVFKLNQEFVKFRSILNGLKVEDDLKLIREF